MTTTRQVLFTKNRDGSSPQDITSLVRSIDITRGASRELETYTAGQCSVILDNRARSFDPNYSGTFSSNVRPSGWLQIKANSIVIFTGFIESWDFTFDIVGDAVATVSASDGLSVLASKMIGAMSLGSYKTGAVIGQILARPEVNWGSNRLIQEGAVTCQALNIPAQTSALDYINQVAKTEFGSVYCGASGYLVFADSRQLTTYTRVTASRQNLITNPNFEASAAGWTIGTRTLATAYVGSYVLAPVYNSGDDAVYANYSETNANKFSSGSTYTVSGYVRLALAGSKAVTFTAGLSSSTSSNNVSVSQTQTLTSASTFVRFSVTITSDLDVDKLGILVEAQGSGLFYVDAVLVEAASTPGSYFDGSNGGSSGAGYVTTAAWDGATDLSTSTLTTVTSNNTDSIAIINLADDGSAIGYQELVILYGSELLSNRVAVSNGTQSARVANAFSGAQYGVYSYDFPDNLSSSQTAVDTWASNYLATYKEPEYRFDSVTVSLDSLSGANQDALLGQDIRDIFNITFTPSSVGSALTKRHSVIGVSHSIAPDSHNITFNLAYTANQIMRWDSLTTGVWDSARWA
jgi:hypothetical protein